MTVARERVKGEKTVSPFTIPAVPQRNRCCALRSPPDPQPAVGSTRRHASIRLWPPSLASSPCLQVSGSPVSAGTRASLWVLCFQQGIRRCLKKQFFITFSGQAVAGLLRAYRRGVGRIRETWRERRRASRTGRQDGGQRACRDRTKLPGAILNSACAGPERASPRDGTSNHESRPVRQMKPEWSGP